MARIGVLGGSFNPPHMGHLFMAVRAKEQHGLDRVLFVPALRPPHRQPKVLASAERRLRMVELAVADCPAFEAVPLELERDGPSYTLQTVQELRGRMRPEDEFFLVLGSDSVADMSSWWRAEELVRQARIITVERPGCGFGEAAALFEAAFGTERAGDLKRLKADGLAPDLSSTAVRKKVAGGESIRDMVPEAVRLYIAEHGLYSRR